MAADVLILGCGFTGRHVASRLIARGVQVTATTREPERLSGLGARVIRVEQLEDHLRPGMLVVHSIPPAGGDGLVGRLGTAPSRVVYLSSTAVYGAAERVDASTPVDGSTDRARERLRAEAEVSAGPWSTLILRAAAIYGPGRGAHESIRRGAYTAGDNYVSRIHVEDLAAIAEAGLFAEITGAYPVADDEPCTTREMAEYCARLLGIPVPGAAGASRATGNRRVDGGEIRGLLGVGLQYPTYREGIAGLMV